jgi:Flp pilus assembly pilin Flp
MNRLARALWDDARGQDLVEYVLIIVFIALGVAAALIALRGSIVGVFNRTASTFSGQAGG